MTTNSRVTRCTITLGALAIAGVFAIPVSASLSTDAFAQQRQKPAITGPRTFQSPTRPDVGQHHYMRDRHNPSDTNGG